MFNELEQKIITFLSDPAAGLPADSGAEWHVPAANIMRFTPAPYTPPADSTTPVVPVVTIKLAEFKAADRSRETIGTGTQHTRQDPDTVLVRLDLTYTVDIYHTGLQQLHAIMARVTARLDNAVAELSAGLTASELLDFKLEGGGFSPAVEGPEENIFHDTLTYTAGCNMHISKTAAAGKEIEEVVIENFDII